MSSTEQLISEGEHLISRIEVEFDEGKEYVRLHIYVRGEWSGLLSVGVEDWLPLCSRLKFFGTSIKFRNIPLAGVPTLPKN